MKIFYEDSELQMYNTSYIMQFYSDDGGASWHTDKIISGIPSIGRCFLPARSVSFSIYWFTSSEVKGWFAAI